MAIDYHKYMASREWALKREAVKERASNVCERCCDAPVQNVHHVTYERLGNETIDDDLLGLCRPCHEYLSGKRDDDPAISVVLACIAKYGLIPTLPYNDWSFILDWTTGPTSYDRYFHGDLSNNCEPQEHCWDNYMDSARLIVPLGSGVWYHCNSY